MTQTLTSPDQIARALWYVDRELVTLREEPIPKLTNGNTVQIRTLYSAISRGTERLVFHGRVPETEWDRMRAPLQQGAFPFPVKYGYCAVGRVEFGPDFLRDKIVFCLHPHQDRFVASANSVVVVRGEVPPKRATLASNMETALNAHWDAGTRPGDRINVIGGGIVGLLIAAVAERIPGSEVVLVDISEEIHRIAAALGITSARPDELSKRALADVVFHTSASAAGLQTAIDCAAQEATVVEVSWYGSREVAVKLGGAFHAKRLRLVSSQVGAVATPQRTRWTHRRRIEKALDLLTDPKLDLLVEGEVPFTEAPDRMADILSPDATGLPPVFAYDAAD